jgi:hypothetical protein
VREKRNAYMVLIRKPEDKALERPRCRWNGVIEWIFK